MQVNGNMEDKEEDLEEIGDGRRQVGEGTCFWFSKEEELQEVLGRFGDTMSWKYLVMVVES